MLRLADKLLGLDRLARLDEHAASARDGLAYSQAVLRALGVKWELNGGGLGRVPSVGPVVFVANHPFGGIEGLILDAMLQRVRPDVKLLANHLLQRVSGLRERAIFVDPFGGASAGSRNRAPMRSAMRWLGGGGALIVFPSGEVAHRTWRCKGVVESPWSPTIARIIGRTHATVVPIRIEGGNGTLFQVAGLIHPLLRTALLPRELLNKHGRTLRLHVGMPIPSERVERFASPETAITYLREKTLAVGDPIVREPVEPPGSRETLSTEIDGLPSDMRLLTSGPLDVYCCPADCIPHALREIGRLREITFRRVGEGTGRSTDIDRFDQAYHHLFVWHRTQRQIVGAYRLGLADRIVRECGTRGLYTHTLFRFNRSLIDQLGPAIELGRSFVIEEHQRSHAALLLLWRGISKFVLNNPRYRTLFGAVSISAEYDSMTKRLMMEFLRLHHFDNDLCRKAKPRHQPPSSDPCEDEVSRSATVAQDIGDVDKLVRSLDDGGRGVPVLIRQYLKLNARLLGFNVDPDFGNVIDGLFYVDLTRADPRILGRYMGAEETRAYQQAWRERNREVDQSESLMAVR